jgi:hypothetical protein
VLTKDATWIAPQRNATQVALGLAADMLESPDGIVAFLVDHFRKLFPHGAQFEFTKVIAEGDTVVFEQRMRFTESVQAGAASATMSASQPVYARQLPTCAVQQGGRVGLRRCASASHFGR